MLTKIHARYAVAGSVIPCLLAFLSDICMQQEVTGSRASMSRKERQDWKGIVVVKLGEGLASTPETTYGSDNLRTGKCLVECSRKVDRRDA